MTIHAGGPAGCDDAGLRREEVAVRDGRTDVLAGNALARAVFAPLFDSTTIDRHGHPDIARFTFLDPRLHRHGRTAARRGRTRTAAPRTT
ncbi:hypothetical protein ACFWM1_20745 [Nocardia sp. NPDC058379]|uniref:MmyB family transcriptional regulator n=1 Tax=unclassified Nocardia TaxID=2637762 RepID=UPI003668E482